MKPFLVQPPKRVVTWPKDPVFLCPVVGTLIKFAYLRVFDLVFEGRS